MSMIERRGASFVGGDHIEKRQNNAGCDKSMVLLPKRSGNNRLETFQKIQDLTYQTWSRSTASRAFMDSLASVPASSCGGDPTSYDNAYLSIPTKHCQLEVEMG